MRNKWTRRIVSIGLVATLSLAIIAPFPLVGCVLLAIDLLRDRRFPLIRAYILVVFYGIWELLGILAATIVWLLSGAWPGTDRSRFIRWNYGLQRFWAKGFSWVGLHLFSMQLHVEEDGPLFNNQPVLILVRHTSLADTILATLLVTVQKRYRLRYVMKRELLWDPCLDIVGNRLPNYFVNRKSANTQEEAVAVAALADNLGPQEGVILWPESTRFSVEKRDRALARLEDSNEKELLKIARELRFVLPPRLMGTLALLERNPTMDVIFCAHSGFENATSFLEIFGGSMIGRKISVKLWGYAAAAVPRNEQEQKRWLYENWQRVDEFVAKNRTDAASYCRKKKG